MNFRRMMCLSLAMPLTLCGVVLARHAGAQGSQPARQSASQSAMQTAAKNPLKIGVLPFTDATGTGASQVGVALSRMVQAEFTHSTDVMAYVLDLGDIKPESLDGQKAVEIARAHNVDAVIFGTVLQADTSNSGRSGGTRIFGQYVGGGVHTMTATVTFQGDLFSVSTGAKIDSIRATGKDTEKKVGPNAWTRLGDINSADWNMENNPLGKALQKAVVALVKGVAADQPKIQGTQSQQANAPKAQP